MWHDDRANERFWEHYYAAREDRFGNLKPEPEPGPPIAMCLMCGWPDDIKPHVHKPTYQSLRTANEAALWREKWDLAHPRSKREKRKTTLKVGGKRVDV